MVAVARRRLKTAQQLLAFLNLPQAWAETYGHSTRVYIDANLLGVSKAQLEDHLHKHGFNPCFDYRSKHTVEVRVSTLRPNFDLMFTVIRKDAK